MLRWPLSSGRAIARLFQALQDVDVFVEDQDDEEFYTGLFVTAASGKTRISKIIGLGGREAVIEAANTYASARPALFLIDGDLTWVRGEPAASLPRLYRLNCYCIENILIVASGAEGLIVEEAVCSAAAAASRLDFSGWCADMESLIELSIRFAVLNKVDPTVATINGALGTVLVAPSKKLPKLCADKTTNEIARVEAEIVARIGRAACDAEVDLVRARVAALKNPLSVVSGKEFLLPLLGFHVKSITGSSVNKRALRFRLARKATIQDLGELVAALNHAS